MPCRNLFLDYPIELGGVPSRHFVAVYGTVRRGHHDASSQSRSVLGPPSFQETANMKWMTLTAAALVMFAIQGSQAEAGWRWGGRGGCCQTSCCAPAPTCCAPAPSCCTPAPAPTCCAPMAAPTCCAPMAAPSCCAPVAPSCCAPANCGCNSGCNQGCNSCCRPHYFRNCCNSIRSCCNNCCNNVRSCCQRTRCCRVRSCCHGGCGGCGGCNVAPSCCAPTCAAPAPAPTCAAPAPSCCGM